MIRTILQGLQPYRRTESNVNRSLTAVLVGNFEIKIFIIYVGFIIFFYNKFCELHENISLKFNDLLT